MKLKYIFISLFIIGVLAAGGLMFKNAQKQNTSKTISLPYFNGPKGSYIPDKDNERWEAALVAAMKCTLGETTNKEILEVFGSKPAQGIEMDGSYSYYYDYRDLEQNIKEDESKGIDQLKNYIVLFFSFNSENKLQGVGLTFLPCPIPQKNI